MSYNTILILLLFMHRWRWPGTSFTEGCVATFSYVPADMRAEECYSHCGAISWNFFFLSGGFSPKYPPNNLCTYNVIINCIILIFKINKKLKDTQAFKDITFGGGVYSSFEGIVLL